MGELLYIILFHHHITNDHLFDMIKEFTDLFCRKGYNYYFCKGMGLVLLFYRSLTC